MRKACAYAIGARRILCAYRENILIVVEILITLGTRPVLPDHIGGQQQVTAHQAFVGNADADFLRLFERRTVILRRRVLHHVLVLDRQWAAIVGPDGGIARFIGRPKRAANTEIAGRCRIAVQTCLAQAHTYRQHTADREVLVQLVGDTGVRPENQDLRQGVEAAGDVSEIRADAGNNRQTGAQHRVAPQ